MRYATAQRTSIGYSPWLNQYPSRVALQQSSFLFLDKHNENKFDFVYLQPVLIMGGLRGDHITHAKQTVWQTTKLLQKRSLRERQLFSLCKSPLNIYLC